MVPVYFHGKFDACNSVINSVCMFGLLCCLELLPYNVFDDLLKLGCDDYLFSGNPLGHLMEWRMDEMLLISPLGSPSAFSARLHDFMDGSRL